MKRRLFGLSALVASVGLMAPGCGFRLRGAPNFAFESIYINMGEGSSLGTELKRSLAANKNLRVISDARQMNQADVILDAVTDRREKTVVGMNASGQVREFQLRLRFAFKLRTPQGREVLPTVELLQQRDISFNETAVLAKEAEESLLYRDMQSDIVQQIMRRLAALPEL